MPSPALPDPFAALLDQRHPLFVDEEIDLALWAVSHHVYHAVQHLIADELDARQPFRHPPLQTRYGDGIVTRGSYLQPVLAAGCLRCAPRPSAGDGDDNGDGSNASLHRGDGDDDGDDSNASLDRGDGDDNGDGSNASLHRGDGDGERDDRDTLPSRLDPIGDGDGERDDRDTLPARLSPMGDGDAERDTRDTLPSRLDPTGDGDADVLVLPASFFAPDFDAFVAARTFEFSASTILPLVIASAQRRFWPPTFIDYTPSSIGHLFTKLGLPRRRTKRRRLFTITVPSLARLLAQRGCPASPFAAVSPSPHAPPAIHPTR